MTSLENPSNNIRIFISSTFNDMQAERDQLVKKTFPILRAHCNKSGVSFTEVDLRWGITNEEASEGKVLSICLAEIEQCRPYFIGILGDRYGWIPDSFSIDITESEPWLVGEKGKSVTELEILVGVLNNPDMAGHAFFYFRQEGVDAANYPDADKLLQLKQRIRKSGFHVKEGFSSPEELGKWIEADLRSVIDPQLVELEKLSDIEMAEIEAKAHLQIQSEFFAERKKQFEMLDDFINQQDEDKAILLLEGEAGIGKYSTLSNWYLQRKDQFHNHRIIFYPTRAEGDFSEVDFMLRYLIHQLQSQSPEFPFPNKDTGRFELLGHLRNAMEKISQTTSCTIIIPAIDQLSDAQAGRGIIWLPNQFPDGIKIMVSASNPDIIQSFDYWAIGRIKPPTLTNNEIGEFTQSFLNQYRKKLSPNLLNNITNSSIAALPINLIIILEELRIFGNHEKLSVTLNDYLTAKDTKSLYLKVIDRWEADYNLEYPDLVKTTLTCIFMTIAGHSEIELRSIIGQETLLPQAYWSPLYIAISKWTLLIKGNLKIGNNAFKEAIIEKYLRNPENVIRAHQLTAAYFLNNLKHTKPGGREFTELPYALFFKNDYQGFVNFYANRETLKNAWKYSSSLVTQYFYLPEKHGVGHFSDIISKEIVDGDDYTRLQHEDVDYLITIADIFQTMGYYEQATMFWNMIAGVGQQNVNDEQFEIGVSKLAFLEMQNGNIDKAIGLYDHLLQHYQQKEDEEGIVSTFHNLGLCHQSNEENEKALEYFEKAAVYFDEKQDMPKLLKALINCSNSLERIARYEEAEKIIDLSEVICKQLGDHVTLAEIYDEKATLFRIRKNYDQALKLHNNAIEILVQLNHVDKYVVSLALRGKTQLEKQNIPAGVEDYIHSIYRCISRGLKQTKDEVIHMLDDSMKWNTITWLSTGNKELLDELFLELDNLSTKDGGMFEEATEEFYQVMDNAIAFVNEMSSRQNSDEE